MTTHPEDAMTRERAMEDAARLIEAEARNGYSWFKPGIEQLAMKVRSLASAQQEPAPAAEVEEVARELAAKLFVEATVDDAAFDCDLATPIIAAALRRYAGDGGVTDAEVEAVARIIAAVRGYEIYENDNHVWETRIKPGTNRFYKNLEEYIETLWREHSVLARRYLEAAARAKSGEKGGTR